MWVFWGMSMEAVILLFLEEIEYGREIQFQN
jgi:hypothetical protein